MLLSLLRLVCNFNTNEAIVGAARDRAVELGWDVRHCVIETTRRRKWEEGCDCRCWWVVEIELKLYPAGEYHNVTPRITTMKVCPDCLSVRGELHQPPPKSAGEGSLSVA